MRFLFALALIICLFTPLQAQAQAAEIRQVNVTGQAPVNFGIAQARDNAIKDARRQAVEIGLGVYVSSQTQVDKNVVVRDKILSRADGYVLNYDILQESQHSGNYYVTIRASVSLSMIGADFKQLLDGLKMQMDSPKIAFVLTTWQGSNSERKIADTTITTAFKQEFLERGFDLKATDKADELANDISIPTHTTRDRRIVREMAANEGANYVARGELKILEVSFLSQGSKVTVQVEAEIIDVNSGENIATYANNFTAINSSEGEARSNAAKKASIVAARQLAEQTISNWQNRSQHGRAYTVELRNVTSAGYQRLPFTRTLRELVTQITNTYAKGQDSFFDVLYNGSKDELGEALFEALKNQPGFSRREFDGPFDEHGRLVFIFR